MNFKGFNLGTMSYVGCAASDVDLITVCSFNDTLLGNEVHYVKLIISGEEYIIAESVGAPLGKCIGLADMICERTEKLIAEEN